VKTLTHSTIPLVACTLLLIPLSGCGSSVAEGKDAKNLVPAEGKVLLDGKPLAGANIVFLPINGTIGTGGFAVTDDAGAYSLTHRSGRDGVAPGQYRVLVSKLLCPDGSPIPEGKTAAEVSAVDVIPPFYSDPNADNLSSVVMVPQEGGAFTFELTSQ